MAEKKVRITYTCPRTGIEVTADGRKLECPVNAVPGSVSVIVVRCPTPDHEFHSHQINTLGGTDILDITSTYYSEGLRGRVEIME